MKKFSLKNTIFLLKSILIILLLSSCSGEKDDNNSEIKKDVGYDYENFLKLREKYNDRYFAIVWDNGKAYFIDEKGAKLFNKGFDDANNFNEGLAAVKENGLWGFIDPKGLFIINPKFNEVSEFSEGLSCVSLPYKIEYVNGRLTNETFGYINFKGDYIIKPIYARKSIFYKGRAKQVKRDLAGYETDEFCIDKKGKKVSNCYDKNYQKIFEGLQIYADQKGYRNILGFADSLDNIVIPANFDRCGNFVNGLAPVQEIGNSAGVVDEVTGAPLYIEGVWGYINKKGDWIIKPFYSSASDFSCVNRITKKSKF
jgi:hypothetical protein